jgi:hypothetical protein
VDTEWMLVENEVSTPAKTVAACIALVFRGWFFFVDQALDVARLEKTTGSGICKSLTE